MIVECYLVISLHTASSVACRYEPTLKEFSRRKDVPCPGCAPWKDNSARARNGLSHDASHTTIQQRLPHEHPRYVMLCWIKNPWIGEFVKRYAIQNLYDAESCCMHDFKLIILVFCECDKHECFTNTFKKYVKKGPQSNVYYVSMYI